MMMDNIGEIVQDIFKYLKSVNVVPEYNRTLNHFSDERWRNHF